MSTTIEKNFEDLFEKNAAPAQVQTQSSRSQKRSRFCVELAGGPKPAANAGQEPPEEPKRRARNPSNHQSSWPDQRRTSSPTRTTPSSPKQKCPRAKQRQMSGKNTLRPIQPEGRADINALPHSAREKCRSKADPPTVRSDWEVPGETFLGDMVFLWAIARCYPGGDVASEHPASEEHDLSSAMRQM